MREVQESRMNGGYIWKKNNNAFITVVGSKHYFESDVFNVGQIVRLVKDYENIYDEEERWNYNPSEKLAMSPTAHIPSLMERTVPG